MANMNPAAPTAETHAPANPRDLLARATELDAQITLTTAERDATLARLYEHSKGPYSINGRLVSLMKRGDVVLVKEHKAPITL